MRIILYHGHPVTKLGHGLVNFGLSIYVIQQSFERMAKLLSFCWVVL